MRAELHHPLSAHRTLSFHLISVLAGPRYGWAKAVHHAAMRHWGDAAIGSWRRLGWAALRRAESGYRAAALLNFLVFLRSGKYR